MKLIGLIFAIGLVVGMAIGAKVTGWLQSEGEKENDV